MKTVRGDATEASEMGDAVMSTMTDRKFRRGIAAAMAVVTCAWGSVSARASADGAAQAVPAAAEISRLEVTEGAPGARVELEADRPVVWTTFRDAEGHLVLELPDAAIQRRAQVRHDLLRDAGRIEHGHRRPDRPDRGISGDPLRDLVEDQDLSLHVRRADRVLKS